MKISNPGPNIWYFEEAIPEAKKFISLLDENNKNKNILSIIPEWSIWMDGGPRKGDNSKWDQIGDPMGENKFVDWDRTLNDFGKIWPKIEPNSSAHTEAYEILKLIDIPFKKVIDHYWSAHPELPKLKYISKNYPIRKYRTGGSMGAHIDINKHTPSMDISILIYLNDDYVGGEIYFNDLDLKIKPSSGSILIFTCNHLHESLSIESGNKIYIPMFVHSKYGLITGFREEYAAILNKIK